eukprot:c11270_g1_i1.p1 GENE.c11270_g1_i1~~c11270_g1_i1.p1  ORF type:complete len:330 (-),score=69.64 c11270_g1_i1:213-1202(-)
MGSYPRTFWLFVMLSRWLARPIEEIQIGVAWPGKRYQIDVKVDITVRDLKNKIMELAKVPVEKLAHYKIKHDTTIVMTRLGVDIVSSRAPGTQRKPSQFASLFESFSLPAESGRYDPHKDPKFASTRDAPKKLQGNSLNQFLDEWFGPRAQTLPAQAQTNPLVDMPVRPESAQNPAPSDENTAPPQPTLPPKPPPANPPPSMDSYKPPVIAPPVPANPQRMDVMAALLAELAEKPRPEQKAFVAPPEALEKEEDEEVIKFIVKCGKKEIKLKMNANQDMWAVKLKLEEAKLGRAGQMVLLDEDGEELDEEGTLAENNIENGSKILLEVD